MGRLLAEGPARVPGGGSTGHGLRALQAQIGEKHVAAKPLRGFGSAGVLEAVEDHAGDTYRAVYTVRFAEAVYVLHAFQKKATRGSATPKHEIDLIRSRLAAARQLHEQRGGSKGA